MSLEKSRLAGRLEDALAETVALVNDRIKFVGECRPQYGGMSTTLTAVALADGDGYMIANVGDSRTYLLRDGALSRLTRDDSLIPAAATLPARAGDRLLLCSDVLADTAIATLLGAGRDALRCAERLVDEAHAAGARDNVTVVVADVVARPDPGPLWPPILP